MPAAIQRVLEADEHVACALVFGSTAHGTSHAPSGAGAAGRRRLGALEFGESVSKLEAAGPGRRADLVLPDEAPPGLAYRVFKDGRVLVERDRTALVGRRARAILEYLDWKPVEEELTRGALRAAARRGR